MKLKFRIVLLSMFCCFLFAQAQDSTSEKRKLSDIIKFNGYLKDLQAASFFGDSLSTYNEIHNRLNFHFYPVKHFSAALEIRNRIIYGQVVTATPDFAEIVKKDNGYVNLSTALIDTRNLVFVSTIDRLWAEWANNKWEIRAGRQRINWGKTLVWNPNDLFNTFNYVDFDYEERPGSDALRVEFFPSGMSAAELAVKPGKNKDETVAAGLYRFNSHGYDVQFLGGLYYTDIALGTGWAGNLGNAGFKGEATFFIPKNNFPDSSAALSVTASMDYAFKNSMYMQGAILYNTKQKNSDNDLPSWEQVYTATLSAKQLMPTEWSFFGEVSGTFTPIFTGDLGVIYGANPNLLFAMPSITYSITENWYLTLLSQNFFAEVENSFKNVQNAFFLRLKWSF